MPAAETFALSVAQRDIWLDQISHGDSPLYNIGAYVEMNGGVDAARLRQALAHLVAQHDGLRTVLVTQGGWRGSTLPPPWKWNWCGTMCAMQRRRGRQPRPCCKPGCRRPIAWMPARFGAPH